MSEAAAALCALLVAFSQVPLGASKSYFDDDAFVHPILHPEEHYAAGNCPQYYLIGQMKCGTTTLWCAQTFVRLQLLLRSFRFPCLSRGKGRWGERQGYMLCTPR